MSLGLELPKPPTIDRDNLAETLERFQRWAVDLHDSLVRALSDVTSESDKPSRPVRLPSVTVAQLAALRFRYGEAAQLVYVSDEAGGPVPAYSDGTGWYRVSDGTLVS